MLKHTYFLLLMLFLGIRAFAQQNPLLDIKIAECISCGSTQPFYTGTATLQTPNIVNDYGVSDVLSNKVFNYSLDYQLFGQSIGNGALIDATGYRILSFANSTITKIQAPAGEKAIHLRLGGLNIAFGGIFNRGAVSNSGMQSGGMVLIKRNILGDEIFIIIDRLNNKAFCEIDGYVFTFNGTSYTTTNQVSLNEAIAPIGRSSPYEDATLRIYNVETGLSIGNPEFLADPTRRIAHSLPFYDISQSVNVVYPGTQKSSIVVVPNMQNASVPSTSFNCSGGGACSCGSNTCIRYTYATMTVNRVEVELKKAHQPASYYSRIKGLKLTSLIDEGGRLGLRAYPTQPVGASNHLDDLAHSIGGPTSQGVKPFAHNRNGQGYPKDEYWFSDFPVRLRTGYNSSVLGSARFAENNSLAEYKDGTYDLYSKITTIDDALFYGSSSFIIDNFPPYVQRAYVTNAGATVAHTYNTYNNNGQLVLNGNTNPQTGASSPMVAANQMQETKVAVKFSEEMDASKVSVTMTYRARQTNSSGSTTVTDKPITAASRLVNRAGDGLEFVATIPGCALQDMTVDSDDYLSGRQEAVISLSIAGKDVAGNNLLVPLTPAPTPPVTIPVRTAAGTATSAWTPTWTNLAANRDERYAFKLNLCPLYFACSRKSNDFPPEVASIGNASGPGICDGSVDIMPGTVGPYTYLWSNGATTEDLSGLCAGDYFLTVTDANGCVGVIPVHVHGCEFPSVSVTRSASSPGICDGGVTLAPSPNSSCTYTWSNGLTTEELSGLCAGAYTVSSTDEFGCTVTLSATVNTCGPLRQPSSSITPTSTTFGYEGAIGVNAPLGYTFVWSGRFGELEESGPLLSNISAGNYQVTFTDQHGCTGTDSYVVPATNCGQPITIDFANLRQLCDSRVNNGSIALTVSGCNEPYSYVWSNAGGATTPSIGGLGTGNYCVTVTDALGCCSAEACYEIEAFGVTPVMVQPCGSELGRIDLGANGNATFIWTFPDGSSFDGPSSLVDLVPGEYCVEIWPQGLGSGGKVCRFSQCFVIEAPGEMKIISPRITPTCSGRGGAIDLDGAVRGCSGDFSFDWDNGDTGPSIRGLRSGTYCVTITDNGGCCAPLEECFDIQDYIFPNAIITPSGCSVRTGSIVLEENNPMADYWWTDVNGRVVSGRRDALGLAPGLYCVAVYPQGMVLGGGGKECYYKQCYEVPASTPPSVILNSVSHLCNGSATARIDVNIIGGTAPYTFEWRRNGVLVAVTEDLYTATQTGTYKLEVRDALGCLSSFEQDIRGDFRIQYYPYTPVNTCNTPLPRPPRQLIGAVYPLTYSNQLNGVPAGNAPNYNPFVTTQGNVVITITDADGCWVSESFVARPPETLTVTSTMVSPCGGMGYIEVQVTSSLPVSYHWNVPSFPILNGSRVDLTNINQAIVLVTITSSSGLCREVRTFTPLYRSNPMPLPNLNYESPICLGATNGRAWLRNWGYEPGLSYLWSNGSTLTTTDRLPNGIVSVTVTDDIGCTVTNSITVTAEMKVTPTISLNQPCLGVSNGSAQVSALPLGSNYAYMWSNGSNQPNLSNLGPGQLVVTVTDPVEGCIGTASVMVAPVMVVTPTITSQAPCVGVSNGSANVAQQGGLGTISYLWNVGGQTTASIANLAPGNLAVTVTDARGCIGTASRSVGAQQYINLSMADDRPCEGKTSGSVNTTVTNSNAVGAGPWSYAWSSSTQGALPTNGNSLGGVPIFNAMGTPVSYCVSVSNQAGCSVSACRQILNTQPLQDVVVTPTNTCAGYNEGSFTITFPTGISQIDGYAHFFNGGSYRSGTSTPLPLNSSVVSGLASDNYRLTITDGLGCTVSKTVAVTVTQPTTSPDPLDCRVDVTSCGSHEIRRETVGVYAVRFGNRTRFVNGNCEVLLSCVRPGNVATESAVWTSCSSAYSWNNDLRACVQSISSNYSGNNVLVSTVTNSSVSSTLVYRRVPSTNPLQYRTGVADGSLTYGGATTCTDCFLREIFCDNVLVRTECVPEGSGKMALCANHPSDFHPIMSPLAPSELIPLYDDSESITKNVITLFPNPANDLLNIVVYDDSIDLVSVVVSNGLGQHEIYEIGGSGKKLSGMQKIYQIDISLLLPGSYYLHIKGHEFSSTQKFIIIR